MTAVVEELITNEASTELHSPSREVLLAAARVLRVFHRLVGVLFRPTYPSLGALALCIVTALLLVAFAVPHDVVQIVCTCSRVRSCQYLL